MAFLLYFVLVLLCIEVSKGAVAHSRHMRMVSGTQEGELVNGTVHNPGNLPFIVHIISTQYVIERSPVDHQLHWYKGAAQCGGTIIRADIVLTAAHCIKDTNKEEVFVHAGIVHTNLPQESKQVRTAKSLVPHEQYKGGWEFDIGIIFLTSKLDITDYVKVVNLPKPQDYTLTNTPSAAGWGTDETGEMTEWLKTGEFMIMDNEFCALGTQKTMTDREICVLDKNEKSKVCTGDSGGPLYHQNILLGVASKAIGRIFPNGSCSPIYPAVFVKVLSYMDWIDEVFETDGIDLQVFRKVKEAREFFRSRWEKYNAERNSTN